MKLIVCNDHIISQSIKLHDDLIQSARKVIEQKSELAHLAYFVKVTLGSDYTDSYIDSMPLVSKIVQKLICGVDSEPKSNIKPSACSLATREVGNIRKRSSSSMTISSLIDSNPFQLPSRAVMSMSREFFASTFLVAIEKISEECLQVIGQIDNKFIACRYEMKHLLLVDQHAADERVQLERRWTDLMLQCSCDIKAYILEPSRLKHETLVLDVPSESSIICMQHCRVFGQWGIVLRFDGSDVIVTHLPLFVIESKYGSDLQWLKRMLVGFANSIMTGSSNEIPKATITKMKQGHIPTVMSMISRCPKTFFEIIQSNACRSAIMFGEQLSPCDCRKLISNLCKCTFPFQCAHGRPSIVPLVNLID